MIQLVQQQLEALSIQKEKTILLAVSGGIDSMVLWDLLYKKGQSLAIAHVNFGLRGEKSDQDQKLVEEIAQQRKVQLHVATIAIKDYAEEKGISIQMAAREYRYDWFRRLQKDLGDEILATAHHLDDSVETLLINLNRGTGLAGLKGIDSSASIFRPLLTVSRKEIVEYAAVNKVKYLEDQSNTDIKYERNWFRHRLLAVWKEHNPQLLQNLGMTMGRLATANQLLNQFIEKELEPIKEQLKRGFVEIEAIQALINPKESLYYFFKAYGFSEEQIDRLVICMKQKAVGKQFVSSTHRLLLDRQKLFFQSYQLEKKQNGVIHKTTTFIEVPLKLKMENIELRQVIYSNSSNEVYFDLDKLRFPLGVRPWKEGDRMVPLGMKGTKKISDMLVDAKVPLHEKSSVYVLTSQENIVWLIGVRMDNRYKISEKTKSIYKISLENP